MFLLNPLASAAPSIPSGGFDGLYVSMGYPPKQSKTSYQIIGSVDGMGVPYDKNPDMTRVVKAFAVMRSSISSLERHWSVFWGLQRWWGSQGRFFRPFSQRNRPRMVETTISYHHRGRSWSTIGFGGIMGYRIFKSRNVFRFWKETGWIEL